MKGAGLPQWLALADLWGCASSGPGRDGESPETLGDVSLSGCRKPPAHPFGTGHDLSVRSVDDQKSVSRVYGHVTDRRRAADLSFPFWSAYLPPGESCLPRRRVSCTG
jgi:hypothetical protein